MQDIRVEEIKLLAKLKLLIGGTYSLMFVVPNMLPVVVFAATTMMTDEPITASKAFTVITLFNILRFPLAFLPFSAVQWVYVASGTVV